MLVNSLLVLLSSQGFWARKSEPSLSEGSAGLFRGSDHYDFAIVVPAAGMECFWHFAHQSGHFYLTYMVQWTTGMATDPWLFVTVSSPQAAVMATENGPTGQMTFKTDETGFYRMCLGNRNNRLGSVRVFLNFGVIYEGFHESEEEKKVLNSTLTGIEESVQRLQNHIFHMWRHYNFARMRKGKDHHLLLSNLSYISWWSAAQCLLIILAGYLQLFVLKKLFHTDSRRSRC